MLLRDFRIAQVGCGIAGDIAGAILSRLGAEVVPVRLEPCPACGIDCDSEEAWRAPYVAAKLLPISLAPDALIEALDSSGMRLSGALLDGADAETIERWTAYADATGIATVVFRTIGDIEDGESFCDGLGGEALSGVIGTMGDTESPTPFGYLFGEVNVAIRGAGALVDRILGGLMEGEPVFDDWVQSVSAGDACIDAMDNPWQEYSLPGPVHDAPNPLTRANYLRTGPQKVGLVPYGLFKARDAWVAFVGASTTDIMAERLQRPDLLTDERFATIDGRVANRQFVVDLLQQWIGGYESGDQLVDALGERVVVAVSRSVADVYEPNRDILGFDNPTQPYHVAIAAGARGSDEHTGNDSRAR